MYILKLKCKASFGQNVLYIIASVTPPATALINVELPVALEARGLNNQLLVEVKVPF